MKLRFKKQAYQTAAVEAVVDCFEGQPPTAPLSYRIDPGRSLPGQQEGFEFDGFKNAPISKTLPLLENIRKVQRRQNLPESSKLESTKVCPINLDIEMETGTGKTYCYIKTMFEMNRRFGWSKFIVVVPSIAIREGVAKSFEITAEHFLEEYHKKARAFIYNSKRLHELESFSSDAGINAMIINVQAFNARGKDARRIYEELDDFQSRRPIDVIKANRPILILDEPQKMEGKKTLDSLKEFNPLMILRYSATHKTDHNKVHRLDAVDAYNQKLVKKIAVRGISVKGLSGTSGYLYLESVIISPGKPPEARLEIEVKQGNGIKRIVRRVGRSDNLYDLSGGLDQYKGFVVADIDARTDTVSFTNGHELQAGEATGDVSEAVLRRIQIREAIQAHFQKEQRLFEQGIKVLTLFFIDEVAKYRRYDESGEQPGEYATMFEEEYRTHLAEALTLYDSDYSKYLKGIDASKTHNGYFSIDKKKGRLIDPSVAKRGETAGESDDSDAYDLILKDKERLLSLGEPTRFIFSHSALREGWDNPNVFVICTLKHSDSTVSRRQEVGRGMRLSVFSDGPRRGERSDDPATVHDVNVLTVVANESYKDFVAGLQKDISETLSERPRVADEAFFTGKQIATEEGTVTVSAPMAKQIYKYLVKNDYVEDTTDRIAPAYHQAKEQGTLAELPEELKPHAAEIYKLIDSVFSEAQIPMPEDGRAAKTNPLNLANFERKEFKELWDRINKKAAYTVHFDSEELIGKCVTALDRELKVSPLQYTIQRGEQREEATVEQLRAGTAFDLEETETRSHRATAHSAVRYDLIGKLAEGTDLTRRTVARILTEVRPDTFAQYRTNPEGFIAMAVRLMNEQKATVIVERLSYDPILGEHDIDIFTQQKPSGAFSSAFKADRHVYEYVFTDSKTERKFVEELDTSTEVVVYAKLPRGFFIPTPVGNYNPDWAIAFKQGSVRHVFFVAETKGSMSSMELREIEKRKIECARKFFANITSDQVRYEVIDGYAKLMDLVV
ncbi:MAG: type III restriction-modification system endonuclease [Phycisphaerales bacterium JB054]